MMKDGLVFFVAETYDSNRARIGSTSDTSMKMLYDNIQSIKLPSILAFYSVDIERDEQTVLNRLREKDLLVGENGGVKNANEAIDVFANVFKGKLTNEAPQVLDEATKKMLDAMLADSDDE
jgi:hypothetical protein